jgi:hypothetical protein
MTERENQDDDADGSEEQTPAELGELYRGGATLAQLVERTGMPYYAVRQAVLEAGVSLRAAHREIPPAPPGFVEAYVRGDSIRAVADAFGVSFGMARRMLLQEGVTLRQRGGS